MVYQQTPQQQPYGGGVYGGAPPPPAPKPSNGVAIAGLVLAFLLPPIGLILSIIGLAKSGRAGRRGIAVAGLVISLVFTAGATIGTIAVVAALKDSNITNALDPGCTTAKTSIVANMSKISAPATLKEGLQGTIDGLTDAESKANKDAVRNVVKALKDDYIQLQTAVNEGKAPSAELDAKMNADGAAFDQVCDIRTN